MRTDASIHWRAYPVLGLAACLAAGIALAHAAPWVTFWVWAGGIAAGVSMAVAGSYHGRRRLVSLASLFQTLGVVVAVVAVGGLRYVQDQALPARHLAHMIYGQPEEALSVRLICRVVERPRHRPTGTQVQVEAIRLITGTDSIPVTGRVGVTLAQPRRGPPQSYPTLRRGDLLHVIGRLAPTPIRRNPADFDYGHYLNRQGIYVTMSIYDAAHVAVEARQPTVREWTVTTVQEHVAAQIQRYIPRAASRAVVQALVLGNRDALDGETRGWFANTGLMHLLAVSGLHVLLVGMIFYGVLRPSLLRLRLGWHAMEISRAMLTMSVLLLYLLVTGASASVTRAVIMAGLLIGGHVLQRSSHLLNTLGVAGVLLLLMQPAYLYDVGFQLSFAAVAAISTLHALWQERLPESWSASPMARHLATATSVSLAATLGTMPVLLYHFGRVSFAGLLLNLVAIPLTGFTLAASLFTVAFGGWFAAAGYVFGAATDLLAQAMLLTASWGDDALGWASIHRYVRDPWYVLALVAVWILLAQWPRPRLRWRMAAVSAGCAGLGIWMGVLGQVHQPRLEVVFFDVGHGDAALVRLPNGRHLLIDAGGRDAYADKGARTILPHLERFGIDRLDAVVISHPHSDHLGGLPALLRSIPVGRVLHNGQPYDSELFAEANHLIDSLAVPHRALYAGDTLGVDPSVLLQVFAPDTAAVFGEANDASIVLRLVYGNTAFLFTGDAEAEAEQQIVHRYGALLRSDVVKVGHHGSRTSSTPPFVAQVLANTTGTTLAVVSVGTRARFGLPNEEVLARWQTHGAEVWTTVRRGALWLRSDGREIEQATWR